MKDARNPEPRTSEPRAIGRFRIGKFVLTCTLTTMVVASHLHGQGSTSKQTETPPATDTSDEQAGAAPTETAIFTDMAEDLGINFVHFNGMSGQYYYCEPVGSGAAMFDYDNDGDLDVYIVQGNMLGKGKTLEDASFPPRGPLPPKDRLYRNELVSKNGSSSKLRFTDVTDKSGIDAGGYGMGVAAGDWNNDGWIDLYVTNFGSNQMWRNNGDGTFADVTRQTGTADQRWSISAAFVDFDRDGWLDLYVGNYVDFSFTNRKKCFSEGGRRDYCGPRGFNPVPERLFRNRRDGTFEDVSAKSQIAAEHNGSLGVVTADFDADGWLDLYVTNDGRPNHLWMNQGDGSFKNEAMLAGCALNADGKPEASMGVDAGDYDNDGDEDLFMTHLNGEKNTLYVNDGNGWFDDLSYRTRLGAPSLPYTAFGMAFFDYDNDGWLDILAVNGEVKTLEALARAKDPYPLHQPNQLFRNLGNMQFEEVTNKAGSVFKLSEVGRGAAFGDVDNDGDTDVLIVNNNGRARLLINHVGSRRHWVGLRLVDKTGNRDMLGTRVAVIRSKGSTLWRRARADGSYASANDPRVLVGLGDSTEVTAVRAHWPNGQVEEWTDVSVDRYTTLQEGSGEVVQ